MQNRKKSNINALTTLLQSNRLTYAEIGKKIKEKMKDPTLGIKNDPWLKYDLWDAEKRVSRLALGKKTLLLSKSKSKIVVNRLLEMELMSNVSNLNN